MSTAPSTTPFDQRFIEYLQSLVEKKNHAALAALRRSLGKAPHEAFQAHRYVLPWLPPSASPWVEEVYYLITSLFALHPTSWNRPEESEGYTNFGASMGRLNSATASAGVERRFEALLACRREDLPNHLVAIMPLMRSHAIPIDWLELLRDLRYWNHETGLVPQRWARAFWSLSADVSTPKTR